MEERGPPADDTNEEPPVVFSETQLVPYGPSHKETYVVQIPKDQIYRVPPPENALLVEKHRKPEIKKKPRNTKCWVTCGLLLAVILITGITLLTLYLTLSPKDPKFSVTKVHVRASEPKAKNNSHPRYEIFLDVRNPNAKMAVNYDGGVDVSLLFKQKEIGKGKFPSITQEDGNDSDDIKIGLDGTSAPLPSEVQKSMNGTHNSKTPPLSLTLKISHLPVKITYGFIKEWELDAEVECDLKVNTLGSGTKVLHQDCKFSH